MTCAALWGQAEVGPEAALLFLPAEHLMEDEVAFSKACESAVALAPEGHLVTFGIDPSGSETGYGYVRRCAARAQGYRVASFVEKPDLATACAYLESGEYFWNSGMFCMDSDRLLDSLAEHAPEAFAASETAWAQVRELDDAWEFGASFVEAPDISIDYALMEKVDEVSMVPSDFAWNDLGAWSAYSQSLDNDLAGNRLHAPEGIVLDTQDCIVHSPHRVTALLGVDNLLVADPPDALLIADKRRDQDVRALVNALRARRHQSVEQNLTVHRPWGTYTVLEEGERFKMKRIVVKPGERLSLQMHFHRSEHWIVVSGTALVNVGDEERLVKTNESTFIPVATSHRLSNLGMIDLVLIEVQSGSYLGEDDIVRIDDQFGRVETQAALADNHL